ncbi:ThiF family adenylyltransferase [Candidatus Woesebacteria bacterium]|nr:ThiF family adenylyltransferase [Candidatus Woesebacteria bacterium]
MKENKELPDWDRIDGIISEEKRKKLNDSSVVMIGLGSLGGEIARLLSMTGVGNFILIDPDKLSASNVVRHVNGLRGIGKYKVELVKQHILNERNPKAKVQAFATDARNHSELVSAGNLSIISGLGSESAQSLISENIRQAGGSTLVAEVFERGEGGRVYLIEPGNHPCYSCFSSFLSTANVELTTQNRVVYGVPEDQISGIPALAVDINRIATIAAEYALRILLDKTFHENPRVNLLYFANKKIPVSKLKNGQTFYLGPLEAQWYVVPKNPDCKICRTTPPESDLTLTQLMNSVGGGDNNDS